MKNLENYNVREIENSQNINGGCFAYDAGAFLRMMFNHNNAAGMIGVVGDYATHYADGTAH